MLRKTQLQRESCVNIDTWARPGAIREGFQEEMLPALRLEAGEEGEGRPRCRGVRWHCELQRRVR